MEIWQDIYKLLLVPLYWHGDDNGEGVDDPSDTEDPPEEPKDDPPKPPKIKTKPDDPGKTNIYDLPEDVDSLSAAELRELLRVHNKALKKEAKKSQERLHEIMEKKAKFKEIEAEKEKARLKELEEKEEYKKLYEDLKPKFDVLAGDVSTTHAYFEKRAAELKDALPEEYQALVPDVDVRKQIEWIENFNKTIVKKKETPPPDPKDKSKTPVGDKGNPPEDLDKTTKKGTREAMEAAILNAKNPTELENLLKGFAKQGIKNM